MYLCKNEFPMVGNFGHWANVWLFTRWDFLVHPKSINNINNIISSMHNNNIQATCRAYDDTTADTLGYKPVHEPHGRLTSKF